MSRLWIISDVQADANGGFGMFAPTEIPEADVLVIAGDFHPPLHLSIASLSKISLRIPVVYVPGNRDYYGRRVMQDELIAARHAANAPQGKGIHILSDQTVEIAGTRFIGSTLWTDMALDGGPDSWGMNAIADFEAIKTQPPESAPRNFHPSDYPILHRRSRAFIEKTLAEPFDGPTVVVSHHSPHPNSIGEKYQANTDGANALFHSDLSEIMEGADAPDMWVHGATHQMADYTVGKTRVLSNPHGYIRHGALENPHFDPTMVVEPGSPAYAFSR